MQEKYKMIFVFSMLAILSVFAIDNIHNNLKETPVKEPNYSLLYKLGLIPNSEELAPTQGDKVIALSNDKTKEMIQHPLGKVYIRNVD